MKKKIKLGLIIVLIIALSAVVIQNRAVVEVHFLWLSGKMPAVLLLFLTSAGGFMMGVLVSLLVRSHKKISA